ncbi:uncharacterized protein PHACADRAFT_124441, partial [Phanerochaete carnosa HHB-10118-sp]
SRKGVPDSLSKHLKEDHPLRAISFGVNSTWFFKEAPRSGKNGSYCLSSSAAVYYPRIHEIYQSDEVINWVAFGAKGDYVVDTDEKIYWHSEERVVRTYKEGGNQVPLRCASFGCDGAWVVVEDDGVIRSAGLSAKIKAALDKKPVRVGIV